MAPLRVAPACMALGRLVLGVYYPRGVWAAVGLVVAWAALWQRLGRGAGQWWAAVLANWP